MKSDREEYARLIAPIEDQMIRTVWRIVRDHQDAQDAFQQALEKVCRRWRTVLRHPNPHAYILRICINCAYDHVRSRRRTRVEPLDDHADGLEDHRPLPSDDLVLRQEQAAVVAAVAALPHMQRMAITMRFFSGLSYREIARMLSIEEATVRKHVFRARKKLRASIRTSLEVR